MKYIFIAVIICAIYKLFIAGNVKNKVGYIALTLATIILGIINLIYAPSLADILKRWI